MLKTKQNNSFEQVIAKAETQIHSLDKQKTEHETRRVAIEAELESIQARRHAREQELTLTLETVQQLTTQHEMLVAQAHLSEGTTAYKDIDKQVSSALSERRRAEQALEKVRSRHATEEGRDALRLSQLQTEQVQMAERLTEIAAQRVALSRAKEQAEKDWAESEYTQVASGISRLWARAEEAKREADESAALVEAAIAQGAARLERWPEYRGKLKVLNPYHDDTTAMLEAGLIYMQALVEHNAKAPNYIDGTAYPLISYSDFRAALCVSRGDLDPGKEQFLRLQVARLKMWLDTYRQQQAK